MTALRCDTPACPADVVAIAPGSEPIRVDLLSALADVPLTRGVTEQHYCWNCWPWWQRVRRAAEQAAAGGERAP